MAPSEEPMGKLYVIAGPSGSGKSTICQRLLDSHADAARVLTCTSRGKRPGEVDGVNYRYYDRPEFERRLAAGEFLEYTEYASNLYGSRLDDYRDALRWHPLVFVVVDVVGVEAAKAAFPDSVVTVGIACAHATLQRRMRLRGETPETIRRRLATFHDEMQVVAHCDLVVSNEDGGLDAAIASIERYIASRGNL